MNGDVRCACCPSPHACDARAANRLAPGARACPHTLPMPFRPGPSPHPTPDPMPQAIDLAALPRCPARDWLSFPSAPPRGRMLPGRRAASRHGSVTAASAASGEPRAPRGRAAGCCAVRFRGGTIVKNPKNTNSIHLSTPEKGPIIRRGGGRGSQPRDERSNDRATPARRTPPQAHTDRLPSCLTQSRHPPALTGWR